MKLFFILISFILIGCQKDDKSRLIVFGDQNAKGNYTNNLSFSQLIANGLNLNLVNQATINSQLNFSSNNSISQKESIYDFQFNTNDEVLLVIGLNDVILNIETPDNYKKELEQIMIYLVTKVKKIYIAPAWITSNEVRSREFQQATLASFHVNQAIISINLTDLFIPTPNDLLKDGVNLSTSGQNKVAQLILSKIL